MSPSNEMLPQQLSIVVGPPASGKTTFARDLAKRTGSILVDIDECTEPLVRASLLAMEMSPDDRDSPRYKSVFREPIYQTLFAIARANLGHLDSIVTGPFTREFANPNWLDELKAELRLQQPVKAYWIHCDKETLQSRMLARANPRDQAKLQNWEEYIQYYEALPQPTFPHEIVNT